MVNAEETQMRPQLIVRRDTLTRATQTIAYSQEFTAVTPKAECWEVGSPTEQVEIAVEESLVLWQEIDNDPLRLTRAILWQTDIRKSVVPNS